MTGASRRLGAAGSAARHLACAAASSAISVSALASTMMSPSVWARSIAADPSAMIPGSVASRCTSGRRERRPDGGAVDALAADHDEPARRALAREPGAVEMLLDAVADRLHDLPPVAPRHIEEALDAEHVMGADQRREPGAERGTIADRPALDDKAVEIVVVVLLFKIVARGPGGEVVLGRGGEAERHRRRDSTLLGIDELHAAAQPGRNVAAQRGEAAGRDQVGLVEDDEIGAGELIAKHLFERVVVIDRRVGGALPRDRLGVCRKAAFGRRRRVDHGDDAVDRQAGADL